MITFTQTEIVLEVALAIGTILYFIKGFMEDTE